jgi:hypothetical protein
MSTQFQTIPAADTIPATFFAALFAPTLPLLSIRIVDSIRLSIMHVVLRPEAAEKFLQWSISALRFVYSRGSVLVA